MPTRSFYLLLVLALALLAPDLSFARASGADTPQAQLVDGYNITLAFEPDQIQTGANAIVVTIRAADGTLPDATVTAAVVAYAAEGGHSDSHEQAPADTHTDDHSSAAPGDSHSDEDGATSAHAGEAAPADSHGDDHAADGHGHQAIPTMLERGSEPGTYRGVLHLEQAGTATITLTFSVDGQERAALFSVPVAQARPRALVLGGFALINGLAIVSAAVLRRRMPKKHRGAAVSPAPSVIPLTMTRSTPEEERPA